MKKIAHTTFFLFISSICILSAQIDVTGSQTSISGGAGITMFFGDVGSLKDDISKFSQIKVGYHVGIEQRIGNVLAFSVNGLFGKLGESDRSDTINRNFESNLMQFDLNAVLHFDNDIIMNRTTVVAPYFTLGFGYTKFDAYADLMDANGTPYYYWTDGKICDRPQLDSNKKTAIQIKRDYTYETQLKDSVTNYARNSFAIPIGFGIKMKMTNSIDFNIGGTYYMTMSDFVDNLKDGKNDSYIYSYFSLQFNFGYKKSEKEQFKESPRYEKVDFSSIDKSDADGDGIVDVDDKCPGTPSGVKSDSKGCPLDGDGDGVADYLDKEAATPKGTIVDEKGVGQTDAMLAQKQAEYDSLATERSNMFNENPSMRYLKKVDEQTSKRMDGGTTIASKIPDELKSADKNNDGYISSDEIIATIDLFFDGDSDFTAAKLNRLIDYFFEQ